MNQNDHLVDYLIELQNELKKAKIPKKHFPFILFRNGKGKHYPVSL